MYEKTANVFLIFSFRLQPSLSSYCFLSTLLQHYLFSSVDFWSLLTRETRINLLTPQITELTQWKARLASLANLNIFRHCFVNESDCRHFLSP